MSSDAKQLLGPDEVAAWLGVPVSTLYGWRYRNVGPRVARVGKHLRYDAADVELWLERQKVSGGGHAT